VSWIKIGNVLHKQGLGKEALFAYSSAQKIREALAKNNTHNPNWRKDLPEIYIKTGDVLVSNGHHKEAMSFFKKALTIQEFFLNETPENQNWQRKVTEVYYKMGDLHHATGNARKSEQAFQKGYSVIEKTAQKAPNDVNWIDSLFREFYKIGDNFAQTNRHQDAWHEYKKGLKIHELLATKTTAYTFPITFSLLHKWAEIGDLLSSGECKTESLTAYRKSLGFAEKLEINHPENKLLKKILSQVKLKIKNIEKKCVYKKSGAIGHLQGASSQNIT
jgi:tetratricopeptide (TPR) repeat protein